MDYLINIINNEGDYVSINDNSVTFTLEKSNKPRENSIYILTNLKNGIQFDFCSEKSPIPDYKWNKNIKIFIKPKTSPKIRSVIIQLYNYLTCDRVLKNVFTVLKFFSKQPKDSKKSRIVLFSQSVVHCPKMNNNICQNISNLLSVMKNEQNTIFVQPQTQFDTWINISVLKTDLIHSVDENRFNQLIQYHKDSTKISQCEHQNESKA